MSQIQGQLRQSDNPVQPSAKKTINEKSEFEFEIG